MLWELICRASMFGDGPSLTCDGSSSAVHQCLETGHPLHVMEAHLSCINVWRQAIPYMRWKLICRASMFGDRPSLTCDGSSSVLHQCLETGHPFHAMEAHLSCINVWRQAIPYMRWKLICIASMFGDKPSLTCDGSSSALHQCLETSHPLHVMEAHMPCMNVWRRAIPYMRWKLICIASMFGDRPSLTCDGSSSAMHECLETSHPLRAPLT
jgi:hypothetical protein